MFALAINECAVERGRFYKTSKHADTAAARRYGKDWREKGYTILPALVVCNCTCGCTKILTKQGVLCDTCKQWVTCKPHKKVETCPLPDFHTQAEKRREASKARDKRNEFLKRYYKTWEPGVLTPEEKAYLKEYLAKYPNGGPEVNLAPEILPVQPELNGIWAG